MRQWSGRPASQLDQPALGRAEQESRSLDALQGWVSSSTETHGESSSEDTEAGQVWGRDTHVGFLASHPLPAPSWHSMSGLAAAMPHLNLASIQSPEPAAPPPRLGSGVSGAGLTSVATIFHLPTSEAKRDLLRKQTVVLFSPLSLFSSTSEKVAPSSPSIHEIYQAGRFCLPIPAPWEPPPGPTWECRHPDGEAQL